jgi:SAGA-associated factor 29
MSLTRENVKLCEEIVAALEGESEQDVNSLIGALNLLSALRASSEAENATPAPRNAVSSGKSSRNAKRKADNASVLSADDRDSIVAESPAAPSPKVHIPAASRLKVGTTTSRAGSVPAAREASVKIEEGSESGADAIKRKVSPYSFTLPAPLIFPIV